MKISEALRDELRNPLGIVHRDFKEIIRLSKDHRIISVGDVCTLSLLAMGIRPHLAVFDHRFMRKELDSGFTNILRLYYSDPAVYPNPAGTLSEEIMKDAPHLIEKGGGVLIEGEEDLTALAFILDAKETDIVVYGQPREGLVIVRPEPGLKKKIRGWLASMPLGHEI